MFQIIVNGRNIFLFLFSLFVVVVVKYCSSVVLRCVSDYNTLQVTKNGIILFS